MPSSLRTALLPLIALALAMPAAAQDGASKKRKPLDPNETICKTEEVLGTRLASRRVCMTRSQWNDRVRTDRETVERSQTQKCVAMNGACTGAQ